ncbi:MAG: transcriptional repressor [Granulosicoccus sp.]|nr:transcriptional repressor [Granulosicoccus sp.]
MNDSDVRFDPQEVSDALRAAGLQVTAQRLAVYRAVSESPHATSDSICQVVREELGVISRQAVYDALNVMSEHGLLRRIQPAGSPARYEHRVDNHHHLACRQCGTLVDVDCSTGEALCLTAEKDHGYQLDEAEVIYWGVCPECQSSTALPAGKSPAAR